MAEIRRETAVDNEIAAFPPWKATGALVHIRANGVKLKAETLVHVMRAAQAAGCIELVNAAGHYLFGLRGPDGNVDGGHCEPLLRAQARRSGLLEDPDAYLDFSQRVYTQVLRDIRAGWEAQPGWEIWFFRMLKLRTTKIAARTRAARRRSAERHIPVDEEANPLPDPEQVDLSVLAELNHDALVRGIDALPHRQRLAATLAWVAGYGINTAEADCVASLMGISETAVHNLLNKARKNLLAEPQIRAIVQDRRL